MTIISTHLCWALIFLLISLIFLLLSLFISFTSISLVLDWSIFSSWFIDIKLRVTLDFFSSWFSFTVCLISSFVIFYSFFYIMPYNKHSYFIWLTCLFVFSMLLVINMTNMFFLILGWDGLGLISFFLIVFYQNQSSISSGLFTILINRVGDCFFIVSISFIFLYYPFSWGLVSLLFDTQHVLICFLLLTFMTKSAIYPFSPWLPLAIAAPTPISSLVHSSTLVTAGLYLIMRFSSLLYVDYSLMYFLLVLSIFTSFYAGINSLFEVDIKKLIALSTLSHLGFIGISFSSGLIYLAFFHLLVHALFKSLLFISIGEIITNLSHSQDVRFLSSGFFYTKSSSFIIITRLLNLLGLPSISGFFSKDLILERFNFSFSSFILLTLVFFNVFFTYYYTYRLFYFIFSCNKLTPFFLTHSASLLHSFIVLSLSAISVVFGFVWVNYISCYTIHVFVPRIWKFTPLILNFFVLFLLILNLKLFAFFNQACVYYFSNIIFLSCIMITISSNFFLASAFNIIKSIENGALTALINANFSQIHYVFSLNFFKVISLKPLRIILFSRFILFLLIILLDNIIYYFRLLLEQPFNRSNIV